MQPLVVGVAEAWRMTSEIGLVESLDERRRVTREARASGLNFG